jgi:hypothetical protein
MVSRRLSINVQSLFDQDQLRSHSRAFTIVEAASRASLSAQHSAKFPVAHISFELPPMLRGCKLY